MRFLAALALSALVALGACEKKQEPMSLEEVYTYARPSIVLVRVLGTGAPKDAPFDPACANPPSVGGTGFVVSSDGYILTNAHVAAPCSFDWPDAPLDVKLADGSRAPARLIGYDLRSDVALIKVERKELKPLALAKPADVRVAIEVVALGFPALLDGDPTFSRGVISGLDRSFENMGALVQTDAAVNKGNSGGPLLDLYGRVVGMNTAALYRDQGFQGINFAVSVPILERVMMQARAKGDVYRAELGNFSFYPLDETGSINRTLAGQPFGVGILLNSVAEDSALYPQLRACDVIEKINGRRTSTAGEFYNALLFAEPEQSVKIEFRRYPEAKCAPVPVCAGKHDVLTSLGTGCPLDPMRRDFFTAMLDPFAEDRSQQEQARIDAEAAGILKAHKSEGVLMTADVTPM